MSKFKVGEICEVYVPEDKLWTECEVFQIGSWTCVRTKEVAQYRITVPALANPNRIDGLWLADDSTLRKLPPKDEPTIWEEVYKLTKWKPEELVT